MNEDSVLVQIKENDTQDEDGRDLDQVGGSGRKVQEMSEFEEFSFFWRSVVQVGNTILKYEQCEYLRELLEEKDLSDLFVNKWEKLVHDDWYYFYGNSSDLLEDLKKFQTKNTLEEELKNTDLKYLNELKKLLNDVAYNRKNILTKLPPVPANKTTFAIENDKNDTNQLTQFLNIIYLYSFFYGNLLPDGDAFVIILNLLEKVLHFKQLFADIIKIYFPNDEKIWQRWMELQQFLTNPFNKIRKLLQRNELNQTEETKELHLFWKLLLDKNDFQKKLKKINYFYYKFFISLEFAYKFEKIFIALLLNAEFDFKKLIRPQQKVIEKSLNCNFPNEWRRMLHLPMQVLQFQQYQLHCCYLQSDKYVEWLDVEEKTICRFDDIVKEIINYVINILIIIEILKNTSIVDLNQLNEDEEFLNNLLKALLSNYQNKCYLLALPPIQKINEIVSTHAPNRKQDKINDVVFNLQLFYKLFVKQKIEFVNWNEEMLENISKNLDNLNDFMNDFMEKQNKSGQFLLSWNEFKMFLKEINNSNEPNLFKELYGMIFDKDREFEVELQNVQPIEFKNKEIAIENDKMHQLQIYIILILNESLETKCFIRNIELNWNLSFIHDKILFQLINCFIFDLIDKICNSSVYLYTNNFKEITNSVEILIKNCNIETKELNIYNDLLIVLKNASKDEENFKSIERLEEIKNKSKTILNSKIMKQNASERKRQIIYDLYCFWRLFDKENELTKKNFCKWANKIFILICLNRIRIDSYLNTFFAQNENNVRENWNCLKELALEFVEIAPKAANDDTFFLASFLNDEIFFSSRKFDYCFNIMNIKPFSKKRIFNYEFKEFEAFIFNLLNMHNSLKQIAHFICWQQIYPLNISINCIQFYYLELHNISLKIKQNVFSEFLEIRSHIKEFNNYLFAYEKFNNNSLNLTDCVKEIEENKTEIYLLPDEIPSIPQNSFQIEIFNNNMLFIQWHQICYFKMYFRILIVNKSKEKKLSEKIQYFLNYIHKNTEKMDEFINNYFGNSENVNIFKTNWNLIKEHINKLSIENSNEFLNVFLKYLDYDHFGSTDFEYFESFREVNEMDAAKHVLLILLNVPLSEVLNSQYKKPLNLNDLDNLDDLDNLFCAMCRYKELKPNTYFHYWYVKTLYDVMMDKFIKDLQYYDNENKSSQKKVKSEFNQLEKREKVAVIKDLMKTVHSKNDGYFKIIFKLFISLLPLCDIFLDIFLAVQFFLANEMLYFYLTLGILLITGFATVTTEMCLESEIKWKPTYYIGILGNKKLKYFFSFTQITLFLRALNEVSLRIKIKRDKTNSYLDYINYGDPEFLKKETATMKYVEMCFEAIPQTILQLYIILVKNNSNPLQLLSILSSICSAMFTVWSFIASRDPKKDPSFKDNRTLLLREFCFYGLRIISTSFILFVFSWSILVIWIIARILLDFATGILRKKYKTINYGFFNGIYSDLLNYKIHNILTLVEFCFSLFWFVYNLRYYSNGIYYDVLIFIVYPILLTIWTRLLCFHKFKYSVNHFKNL